MKIDQQYLKDLLIAFENSEGPDTTLQELQESGYEENSSEFIFHMRLMYDNGLVVRVDGESGFGHEIQTYMSGHSYYWIDIPLRLTSRGHDFIADLRQKEVWETVKNNFKDEGISTLMGLTKSLAMGFAKKKVKALTGLDID